MKRLKFKDGKGLWFTSDHHFFHDKIIQPDYADRPFESWDEMNGVMIARWNELIQPDDTVFYLGDFMVLKDRKPVVTEEAEKLLARLHGTKHLIVGNHDHTPVRRAKGWASVEWYQEITVGDQPIVMNHCPFLTWPGSHRGSWSLHGHCHDGLKQKWKCPHCSHPQWQYARRCDVGVDAWGFRPVNMDDLTRYMADVKVVPVDHHDERGR